MTALAAFLARVPELSHAAHEVQLRQWAELACVDLVFVRGWGFRGVLKKPTTLKKFQSLLVTNLKNWGKKGALPGFHARAKYERGWLQMFSVAEYLKVFTPSPCHCEFSRSTVDSLIAGVRWQRETKEESQRKQKELEVEHAAWLQKHQEEERERALQEEASVKRLQKLREANEAAWQMKQAERLAKVADFEEVMGREAERARRHEALLKLDDELLKRRRLV
jgi:hypothetical protein